MSEQSAAESPSDLNQQIAMGALNELGKTRRHANYRMMAIVAFGLIMVGWNMFIGQSLFGGSTLEIPKDEPYVALVRIRGEIQPGGSASAEFLKPILTQAFLDEEAKGVVLLINSPGGTPVQADLLHDYIVRMKNKYDKKVVAIGEDQLTSGAYMTAVAADSIYVNESTMAGSIGVVADNKGYQELANKVGVENRVITAGDLKYRLDPFDELKEEDVLKMKEALEKIHHHFIETVVAGRGDRLNGAPELLYSGDWWTGNEVVELGLVDGIADLETVLEEEFGVIHALDYSRRKGLLSGLTDALVRTAVDELVTTIESKLDIQQSVPNLK